MGIRITLPHYERRAKMPKMVCVTCQTELKIKKNGIACIETVGEQRQPCNVIQCDKWKCPVCGLEILAGFALNGTEPWEPGFEGALNTARLGIDIYCNHELKTALRTAGIVTNA